ncbi:hypothetical protein QBC33DRAFT_619279 [Phialemonium atrogriseum]|uniref:Uncharacterized protein n=1 Tax=Phialemonium atrogriseum TaxID=1093897 RepID=A0AAJ0C089_9PEZI|nr:uncharacterized protein QBC33DRAFT_619279 [Phialemonium atrogriseum]KAK1767783.1 hypothetical protein QBC33DRAFT_619279 [Phialemonium atrogriseum]
MKFRDTAVSALAGRCFSLSQRQLSRLSAIRSVPGVYSVGHDISRQKRLRLVSVRSAKRLAITIHGSAESITRALSARRTKVMSEKEFYTFKYLQDAPLEPLGQDPSLLPSKANAVDDAYCGMESIHFPSLLPDRRVENGLWCRGCEWTCERYRFGGLVSNIVSGLVPPNREPLRVLMGSQRRGRSEAGFLEHIKHCRGVRGLVPDLGSWNETG